MRSLVLIGGLLLLAGPALADQAAPGKGRYAIQPGDDGFVRLDTETGSVSHCKRVEGIWQCDAIADGKSAIEGKIDILAREVAALSDKVERLNAEVATLKAAEPGQPHTRLSPEDERELDKAIGFAERLMKRFFEMVRDLKGDERPSI
jgi:hypothetical protein